MATINIPTYCPVETHTSGVRTSTTRKTESSSSTSSVSSASVSAPASSKSSSAIAEFLEYQKMTPEEKLRDAILKKLDMTEEELAALPPEERAKVEEKIKEMMKQEIENNMAQKGVLVDLSA